VPSEFGPRRAFTSEIINTMSQQPTTAHDVLAAEEFGVPAPDPALHHESARDVLAAEEFGVPAPDPSLRHGPVTLPGDPAGIAEPHDVLAAEEFAMPAPSGAAAEPFGLAQRTSRSPGAILVAGTLAVLAVRRLRRR